MDGGMEKSGRRGWGEKRQLKNVDRGEGLKNVVGGGLKNVSWEGLKR